MTRNSSPPHCRPITILILTLAIGTMFIGMTMTIVAHWPGSVSVGFDPLSIPGPIILALGGIAFIIGSILVCYFQRVEQKKKGEKFVSFATTLSRANLDASAHHHSKQGSQLLEKEPLRKVGKTGDDFDDFGSVDEAEAEPLRPGKNIKGQQVLDEVITTTTSHIEPMPGQSDDEYLPLPVRSKKNKNNGSNDKPRVIKGLENLSEVSEETEEPLMTSGRETEEKTKVKAKKKKKKINTDYSREILHSKRSSSEEDRHQQIIHNQEHNGDDDGNDDVFPGQGLRIQVRAKPGTAVNIRHSSQNEETPPQLEKKKKSKRAAQS